MDRGAARGWTEAGEWRVKSADGSRLLSFNARDMPSRWPSITVASEQLIVLMPIESAPQARGYIHVWCRFSTAISTLLFFKVVVPFEVNGTADGEGGPTGGELVEFLGDAGEVVGWDLGFGDDLLFFPA